MSMPRLVYPTSNKCIVSDSGMPANQTSRPLAAAPMFTVTVMTKKTSKQKSERESWRQREGACLWAILPRVPEFSHTLLHTAARIHITVNPKCHRQIPESSSLAYHRRFCSTPPLPQFQNDFKILLSTLEAYPKLATTLRFLPFVRHSWAPDPAAVCSVTSSRTCTTSLLGCIYAFSHLFIVLTQVLEGTREKSIREREKHIERVRNVAGNVSIEHNL